MSGWLALDGVENVRDIGGLPLRDGGVTRSGVLLRSANLRHATPADVEHLVEVFGLELILDLRTPREINRDGPPRLAAAGVRTVRLNFLPDHGEPLPWGISDDPATDPLLASYRGYLDGQAGNVAAAVVELADGGPALVHCAAGKDRTGVLIALVLDVIGVERTAVLADYARSGERVPELIRRWMAESGAPVPQDLSVHMPRPAVLGAVLAELDAEHGNGRDGGAVGWLRAQGVDQATLELLRARFTG